MGKCKISYIYTESEWLLAFPQLRGKSDQNLEVGSVGGPLNALVTPQAAQPRSARHLVGPG